MPSWEYKRTVRCIAFIHCAQQCRRENNIFSSSLPFITFITLYFQLGSKRARCIHTHGAHIHMMAGSWQTPDICYRMSYGVVGSGRYVPFLFWLAKTAAVLSSLHFSLASSHLICTFSGHAFGLPHVPILANIQYISIFGYFPNRPAKKIQKTKSKRISQNFMAHRIFAHAAHSRWHSRRSILAGHFTSSQWKRAKKDENEPLQVFALAGRGLSETAARR